MSWLSVALHNNSKILKPIAIGAGTLLGSPALGAAIAGGWNYADNHDLGKAALDAGLTFGGGKLLQGAGDALGKVPGVSSATDAIGNVARGVEHAVPGLSTLSDTLGHLPQNVQSLLTPVATGAPQAASGLSLPGLGDIGTFLTGNNGLNALGIAQGANAAALGQKSSNFGDLAAKGADARWNAQAPLRAKGIQGMLAPAPIDLSGLQAQRQVGNPFARPVPLTSGA